MNEFLKKMWMLEDGRWAVEFWRKGVDGGTIQYYDDQESARELFNSLDANESDLNFSDVMDFIERFRPMYSLQCQWVFHGSIRDNFCASSNQAWCESIYSEDLRGIVSRLLDRHNENEVLFSHRIGFIEWVPRPIA